MDLYQAKVQKLIYQPTTISYMKLMQGMKMNAVFLVFRKAFYTLNELQNSLEVTKQNIKGKPVR